MAPFPCIATNTSPPLGGGVKKIVVNNKHYGEVKLTQISHKKFIPQ